MDNGPSQPRCANKNDDSKESGLYRAQSQAQSRLEKKLLRIQHGDAWINADEEAFSKYLLTQPTRKPFQYCLTCVLDEDQIPSLDRLDNLRQEAHYLRALFYTWCENALDPDHWIDGRQLPSMFRFVFRRPLMPESELRRILEVLNIDPELKFVLEENHLTRRSRSILRNTWVEGDVHVSTLLRDYKRVYTESMEERVESPGSCVNKDADPKVVMSKRLWALYSDIEQGFIELSRAPGCYRDLLGDPGLDYIGLADALDDYGLISNHISQNGTAAISFSGDKRKQLSFLSSEIRSGCVPEEDVLSRYQSVLSDGEDSGPVDYDELVERLESYGIVVSRKDTSESRVTQEQSSADTSKVDCESHVQCPRRACGAMLPPCSPFNKDEKLVVRLPGSYCGSVRPALLALEEPSTRLCQRPVGYTTVNEQNADRAKTSSLALPSSRRKPGKDWEHYISGAAGYPLREMYDPGNLSSSPEEGMSSDLWGLAMRTKAGKSLCRKMNLPSEYIRKRVRSCTPRRQKMKKHRKATRNIVFPTRKRRASFSPCARRSSKLRRKSFTGDWRADGLFALENEDHVHFVSRHLSLGSSSTRRDHRSARPRSPDSREDRNGPCTPDRLAKGEKVVNLDLYDLPSPMHVPASQREGEGVLVLNSIDSHCVEDNKSLMETSAAISRFVRRLAIVISDREKDWLVEVIHSTVSSLSRFMRRNHQQLTSSGVKPELKVTMGAEAAKEQIGSVAHSILVDIQAISQPHLPENLLEELQSLLLNLAIHRINGDMMTVGRRPGPPNQVKARPKFVADAATAASSTLQSYNGHLVNTERTSTPLKPPTGERQSFDTSKSSSLTDYCYISTPTLSWSSLSVDSDQGGSSDSQGSAEPIMPATSFQDQDSAEKLRSEQIYNKRDATSAPNALLPISSTLESIEIETEAEANGLCEKSKPSIINGQGSCHSFSGTLEDLRTADDNKVAKMAIAPPPAPSPAFRTLKSSSERLFDDAEGYDYKPLHEWNDYLNKTRSPRRRYVSNNGTSHDLQTRNFLSKEENNQANYDRLCEKENIERRRRLPPSRFIEKARKQALRGRNSFFVHLELCRFERTLANYQLSKDRYFQSSNGSSSVSNSTTALNKLFDKYRVRYVEAPRENPDIIAVEGSIKYLGDLGVNLDEVAVLAVLAELAAPTMGELSREGFVQGWKTYNAETIPKQQATVANFRRMLPSNQDFFKRVYKHTFIVARAPGQKSVALEVATEYWRLLFQSPSVSWKTSSTPWLEWWIEFLDSKWKKSVNKDMWDQTFIFAMKSLEDESMSWWSEDGAWPGVLDDFVMFVGERKREGEGRMEVE